MRAEVKLNKNRLGAQQEEEIVHSEDCLNKDYAVSKGLNLLGKAEGLFLKVLEQKWVAICWAVRGRTPALGRSWDQMTSRLPPSLKF